MWLLYEMLKMFVKMEKEITVLQKKKIMEEKVKETEKRITALKQEQSRTALEIQVGAFTLFLILKF